MDCVTTRLQMEIGMFFMPLTLKNARKLGKLATFFMVVREPRKILRKWFKKVVRNSEVFPRKCRNFLGGPRTKTKFVKWAASRKRLRTAALVHIIYLNGCNVYDKRSHCDVKSINALYILFIHVDRNSFCYVTAATICEDSLTNRVWIGTSLAMVFLQGWNDMHW